MSRTALKTISLALLLALAAGSAASRVQAQELNLQETVPLLDIQDRTLQDVLLQILEGTGMSVVIPTFGTEQDSIRISRLRLRNTTVDRALRYVLEPQGLTYRVEEGVLRIEENLIARTIRFEYLATRFAIPMQAGGGGGLGGATGGVSGGAAAGGVGGATGGQQTINQAGLTRFEQELENLITDEATLIIHPETHTIYVRDYAPNVWAVEDYIQAIDVAPRQVKIEVRMLEVLHTGDTNLGVSATAALTGSPDVDAATVNLQGTVEEGGFLADLTGFRLGGLYGGNLDLDAAVNAVATVSEAELLSRPSTVVLDGRQANISLTDQIPYTEAAFGQGISTTTTQFKDVGIIMNVVPTILDSNTVQLQVSSTFSTAPTRSATGVPTVSQRNAYGSVVVNDGEFFIMAGLLREEETTTQVGIPILRSIPLLKYLFSSTRTRKENRELIIFIMPTIIQPGSGVIRTGSGPGEGPGGGVDIRP